MEIQSPDGSKGGSLHICSAGSGLAWEVWKSLSWFPERIPWNHEMCSFALISVALALVMQGPSTNTRFQLTQVHFVYPSVCAEFSGHPAGCVTPCSCIHGTERLGNGQLSLRGCLCPLSFASCNSLSNFLAVPLATCCRARISEGFGFLLRLLWAMVGKLRIGGCLFTEGLPEVKLTIKSTGLKGWQHTCLSEDLWNAPVSCG